MPEVGIIFKPIAIIRQMIDLFFTVGAFSPLPGWCGFGTLPNGHQLSLHVCNCCGKGCIADGESYITLHQRSQDVFFRRGRIGQGAEVPIDLFG